jgi:hypothetical protein
MLDENGRVVFLLEPRVFAMRAYVMVVVMMVVVCWCANPLKEGSDPEISSNSEHGDSRRWKLSWN